MQIWWKEDQFCVSVSAAVGSQPEVATSTLLIKLISLSGIVLKSETPAESSEWEQSEATGLAAGRVHRCVLHHFPLPYFLFIYLNAAPEPSLRNNNQAATHRLLPPHLNVFTKHTLRAKHQCHQSSD